MNWVGYACTTCIGKKNMWREEQRKFWINASLSCLREGKGLSYQGHSSRGWIKELLFQDWIIPFINASNMTFF